VVNERDELGPDLVPDYMTSIRDGGFYGWPYSYFGQHVDPRVSTISDSLRDMKAVQKEAACALAAFAWESVGSFNGRVEYGKTA
jgi:glucose/arabinose dehydrogenase